MNLLANLISLVASPLAISAPASYALVFKSSGDVNYSLIWTIASMLFASTAGVFVLYGIRKGMFSDFDISKREERKPIFIFSAIISVLYLIVIFFLDGPRILIATLGALLLGVFLASVINRRIKASIHLAVFSSFSIILGILYGGIFWLLVFFIPVVAWSRIKLKRHTPQEAVVGTILGLVLVVVIYFLLKHILNIQ